jgi:hypothetical protein
MTQSSPAVDTANLVHRITHATYPGSRKKCKQDSRSELRAPFRELAWPDSLLETGAAVLQRQSNPSLRLCDTSVAHGDLQRVYFISSARGHACLGLYDFVYELASEAAV